VDGRAVRILALTNMYPTAADPQFGAFVAEQVDDLRRAGVDVDILAFDGRAQRSAYVRAVYQLERAVHTGRYDLLHAHYGLTGLVARTQLRVPVVTTFYGSDISFVRWQRRVGWLVARLTTPIFVSRRLAELVGLHRSDVVPTPVDTARFRPIDQSSARKALGLPADATYVVFPSSRRNRVKDAGLFDAAVDALREDVPAVCRLSLEQLSREQVALVFNAADATLLTSLSEGSPVAVKESLACCTPVVAVDVGDVSEVIADLPGCSIASREPRRLAAAVRRGLELGKRPELRERALEYSHPVVTSRLLEIFDRVLAAQ
jgi:teichuronic acid biosynthesis glycosyltransferase TuaC